MKFLCCFTNRNRSLNPWAFREPEGLGVFQKGPRRPSKTKKAFKDSPLIPIIPLKETMTVIILTAGSIINTPSVAAVPAAAGGVAAMNIIIRVAVGIGYDIYWSWPSIGHPKAF